VETVVAKCGFGSSPICINAAFEDATCEGCKVALCVLCWNVLISLHLLGMPTGMRGMWFPFHFSPHVF